VKDVDHTHTPAGEPSIDTQLQHELATGNTSRGSLRQFPGLDQLLYLNLVTTLRLTDSQAGSIHLLAGPGAGELRLRVYAGLPAGLAERIETIPCDDPDVQRIIASGEPAIIQRFVEPADEDECPSTVQDGQSLSDGSDPNMPSNAPGVWVSLPLLIRDQFQGLLSLTIEDLTPERAGVLKITGQQLSEIVDSVSPFQHSNLRLLIVESIAQQLAGMLDEEAICQAVCDACVDQLGYRMAWIGMVEHIPLGMMRPVTWSGFEAGYLDAIQVEYDDTPLGHGPTGTAIREGRPVLQPHLDNAPDYAPWRQEALSRGYRSSVAFPLKSPTGVIGALNLYAAKPDAFTDEDLLALDALSAQTANTIENARRVQAERRQREVAEMLQDLVVTVNSTLDVDQVLNIAVRRLHTVHQAAACSVSFLQEDGETFVFRASTDPGIDLSQPITFPASHSVAGHAMRERKVQIVNEVDQSRDYRAEIVRRSDIVGRSLLTAPLFAGDRPLGVIQVLSASTNAFDEDDAELLTTTAALIETAVARAQAYTQAVHLAQAEHRQQEVTETLRRVAMLINASLDLDTVLDRILEQLAQVVDYDSTSLMLAEAGKLTMRAIRGFEESDRVLPSSSSIENNPLFQEMLASRRPIVISDVKADARYRQWVGTASIRSWIGVPLIVRDRVIGQLAVDRYQPDSYDESDAQLAFTFAQQAAIAIENAQLFEAAQEARQLSDSLREIGASLVATLNPDEVMGRVLDGLARVIPYDSASVMLIEAGMFRMKAGRGILAGSPLWTQSFAIEDRALNHELYHSKKPIIVPDVEQEPRWVEADDAEHTRCWLGVPLVLRDQVIGVMNLDQRQPDFYTAEHAAIASAFAAHAAIAIENARLYEEERERLVEMERRNRELAALHAVAAAVSSSLNIEVVLRKALEQALETTEMEAGAVYFLEESGTKLDLSVEYNLPEKVAIEGEQFELDRSLSGWVAQTGEPIAVQNMLTPADDLPIHEATRLAAIEAGYQSLVVVPLRAQGRIVGTFFGISRQSGQFSPQDLKLLSAIGDEMGVAVENARLHRALQEYAAGLEARVEARTVEVSRERERLLAVLESAGDGIVITNADGVIEYANPAWERLTGYDITQAIQQETRILDDEAFPDLSPKGTNGLAAVYSATQPQRMWRKELIGKRPDGTTYAVDLTVTPVFDDATELANLVVIYRDVTQYKELDRIKSEFLSTASHELRSPLTSILGFSELLLGRADLSKEEQARFLKYVHDHASQLKQLVDDLLDISRIEAGVGLTTRSESLDLYPLFEKEIQVWQETHPNHRYDLRVNGGRSAGPASNWPQVHADPDHMVQVIRNLLSNATKYSPGGGKITVGATPVGGYLEVTIADNGIGMSNDELPHLFEKFWRADASSTAIEGTGLGLVIVKHMVEQEGGHIWVESTQGKGTVVHFTLPLVERQTTVLIVEDEDAVREIEQRILAGNGIATLLASNGQQAIELAQAQRPDLILLDLMIPHMSGKEVLYALKSDPSTQHIPVLVVSGRSSWKAIEESYMLGAVDFLSKPFEYEELLGRVRRGLKIGLSGRQQVTGNH